jgi:hypothetical protein
MKLVVGCIVAATAITLILLWGNIIHSIDRIADLEVQAETLWSAVSVSGKQDTDENAESWFNSYRVEEVLWPPDEPEPECDGLAIYSADNPVSPGDWNPGDNTERSCVDYGVAIHTILDHIGYEFKYIGSEPAHHVFVPKEGK